MLNHSVKEFMMLLAASILTSTTWRSSFELEQVRKYIREQESADGNNGSF